MFKCMECGYIFEEGEEKLACENMGEYFGFNAVEKHLGCPHCEGAFEEIEPCKICGNYESKEIFEEVCEICKCEILKRYRNLLESEFTPDELEVLNEILESVNYEI